MTGCESMAISPKIHTGNSSQNCTYMVRSGCKYRTSVPKIHPKNIFGSSSQNQLIEASTNYWTNDLLGTISLILNVQCPWISKPEFQFQLNKESAANKFCITNEYNKDLSKAISAQFNSPLGYGSEFRSINTLEVLFSRHPNLTGMKNILENGSAWPLEELEESKGEINMKEALSFGNHKGAVRNPILLRKHWATVQNFVQQILLKFFSADTQIGPEWKIF